MNTAAADEAALLRSAGRGWLSLALIDARNHTLRLMAAWEEGLRELPQAALQPQQGVAPPLWLCGRIGWFQEAWLARNMQRRRGSEADPQPPRLASVEPAADAWFDDVPTARAARPDWRPADADTIRRYLLETLETTLDLLESTPDDGVSLYFYRLALAHEDLRGEQLVRQAQTLGLAHPVFQALAERAPRFAPRAALWFPDTRFSLGWPEGAGFCFDNERAAHEIAVPGFEIDAQPVSWAAYGEFVEDGGYDEARWWTEDGRAWLARTGRRTPRHVEQMRAGVLASRFGRTLRMPSSMPAVHVTLHEAQAWCAWAGRRLPSEVEWELACLHGASRGWRSGEVWEWTASRFRPYPGFLPGPWRDYSEPAFGRHWVVRGGSFATSARLRHPRLRGFRPAARDDGFVGFRSCRLD